MALTPTFAPIVTRIAPTDLNAVDVFSGGRIRVIGFTISNTTGSAAVATVRTNETSPTTVFTGQIAGNLTVVVPIPFIADKGLEVLTGTADALSFTFFHTHEGT